MERNFSIHVVKVLDLSGLEKEVKDFLISKGIDMADKALDVYYGPLGIVTDAHGKHYLINSEACGESNPIESHNAHINWYKKTIDETGNTVAFDMTPCVSSHSTMEEIKQLPVEKFVRLDEFVRPGGGRVTENCNNWDRFLTNPDE